MTDEMLAKNDYQNIETPAMLVLFSGAKLWQKSETN